MCPFSLRLPSTHTKNYIFSENYLAITANSSVEHNGFITERHEVQNILKMNSVHIGQSPHNLMVLVLYIYPPLFGLHLPVLYLYKGLRGKGGEKKLYSFLQDCFLLINSGLSL